MESEEHHRERIQNAINTWHKKWDKLKKNKLSYRQKRQVKRHYTKWELRRAK